MDNDEVNVLVEKCEFCKKSFEEGRCDDYGEY